VKIVLVHGFNDPEAGADNIDKLAPILRAAGHEVEVDEADYGYYGLLAVRFHKRPAVRRIKAALANADAVVSYSNGSNYENKALRSMRSPRTLRVVRISPALNRRTGVADNVSHAHVFYTRADWATLAAGLIPLHPWGSQGRLGYRGKDRRIKNWDYTEIIGGHTDWFADDNLEQTAQDVLYALETL
jgi:hypothetical protein